MNLSEIAFFSGRVPQVSEFYRRLPGVEPGASSEKMTIFFLNDTRILIHYRYLPQAGELPPEDHHAFLLEDVDAACERMVEQGLTLEVAARDFPWGRSAYVRDPDGRQIEITQKGSEPLEGDSSHAG